MTLAHDMAGAGPTVILIHSTATDRRQWAPQVPALTSAGYRVVRADLRGFGDTPVPDGPYNNAQDVFDLLDQLDPGRSPVAVVGSSGGGRVALEIAARWPRRVAALALLCTALTGHEPSAELGAFGDEEDALLEAGDVAGATELNVRTWLGPRADDAVREQVRRMQRHAFEVQLAATEEYPQLRVETDLSAIAAPTLLVSGAHDVSDFGQIARDLAGRLADARHVELAEAGHLPNLECPDETNALLVDFLRTTFPAR